MPPGWPSEPITTTMARNNNSFLAVFVIFLVSIPTALSAPEFYRAPPKGAPAGNPNAKILEARGLPVEALVPVPVVVNLIASLHYEYWCTEFLGWPTDPAFISTTITRTKTNTETVHPTVTVNDIMTVTSGTSTAVETNTAAATYTSTSIIATTTTTTTTQTVTPTFTPNANAKRSDIQIPDFLNGCDKAIISSACSQILQPSPRASTTTTTTTTTFTAPTRTATIYTATITTAQTITTLTTLVPTTTTTTTTKTTTSTSTSIFTRCPAATRVPGVFAIGTNLGGDLYHLPSADSIEACCLACYNPNAISNCNAWAWQEVCIIARNTGPGSDPSAACPVGLGDAMLLTDAESAGEGGPGPCARNIDIS